MQVCGSDVLPQVRRAGRRNDGEGCGAARTDPAAGDAVPAPRASGPGRRGCGRHLRRAGLRLRPGEFVLLWAACTLGLGTLGLGLTHLPLMALLLGLIGAGLPPLILRAGEDGRRRRFDEQLTDTLTLLVSALRSGYSLARAAQVVAEEMPPPVSEEFAVALGEMALGLPLAAALARMTERVGSPDLELIVTAVTTQQQVGGNLAEILSRIAGTIRERVRVQGEIRTLTAEGKLSSLILILLPPALALLLTLRNPHYFQPLLDSPLGHVLIAGARAGSDHRNTPNPPHGDAGPLGGEMLSQCRTVIFGGGIAGAGIGGTGGAAERRRRAAGTRSHARKEVQGRRSRRPPWRTGCCGPCCDGWRVRRTRARRRHGERPAGQGGASCRAGRRRVHRAARAFRPAFLALAPLAFNLLGTTLPMKLG